MERMKPIRRACGFTLLEALLVVTVMVVLVSLLLPVLSGARQAARGAQCKGRLRQIFQYGELYRADWKRYYMVSVLLTSYPNYTPPANMWFFFQIEPYMNVAPGSLLMKAKPSANMLMCPASYYSPSMTLTESREHVYAESRYGNYWISSRFGYNPSDFAYPMRRFVENPSETAQNVEVRGSTYNKVGHVTGGVGAVVFNHPRYTTHVMMSDGGLRVTGATSTVGMAGEGIEFK